MMSYKRLGDLPKMTTVLRIGGTFPSGWPSGLVRGRGAVALTHARWIGEVAASAVAAEGLVANDANATLDAANWLPTLQERKLDPMPIATTPRADRTVITCVPIFVA
jgi:hypothetical protein